MDVVASLLYKIDLVDLAGHYTDLKEDHNGTFRGKCPIHHGDNPTSFAVYPDGTYYCFACHSFGNAIQFYSEVTGYPFYQAVEKLCEEYEVSTDDATYQSQKKIVGHNTHIAARMARQVDRIHDYLTKSRGLTDETIKEFKLGYDYGGFIGPYAGLVIPLQDVYGRIVGFTKRRLDEGKPKYRNTSDNDAFKKGSILYNYHRAIKRIKEKNTLHVVEGNMDVISAHQQGLACVGYMSSKPTQKQLLMLSELQKRFPDMTVVLSVDNPEIDAAGKKMLPRIYKDILTYTPNLNVRCPIFPKGD